MPKLSGPYRWPVDYDTVQRFRELSREYAWEDPESDRAGAIREEIYALPGYPQEARRDAEMGLEPLIELVPIPAEPEGFSDVAAATKGKSDG